MDSTVEFSGSETSGKAEHLCVLVHGLWGNTQHLNYIKEALQERYSADELCILACKRNASFYTYDGIEIGGERVAKEIEDTIEELSRDGHKIKKLSMVGYSLGGLIARYAIGLLDHKGYFDHIQPVNFTTFASPHLGVRTPLVGYANHLWNVLGARSLSESGRQLFAVDHFRDTGRPILSVMADADSIFIKALKRFRRRTLYANVVNDRTAVYYTTGISTTNPWVDMEKLKLNYVEGYDPVILDPAQPCELLPEAGLPSFYQRLQGSSTTFIKRLPIYLALSIFIPIGVVIFSVNATIQTFRSRRRIILHESDQEDQGFGVYRVPYMIREVRAGIEDAFESTNSAQQQEYLPPGSAQAGSDHSETVRSPSADPASEKAGALKLTSSPRSPEFPKLALTSGQFEMVKSLDQVGFRKYPVYIHQSTHSHAAMIVRTSRAAFAEGKIVIKHWLDREFEL